MREIELHGKWGAGLVAVVSDDDFDELSKYRWIGLRCRNTIYAGRLFRIPGRKNPVKHLMHRVITGVVLSTQEVDHVDGNALNNQRCNLRVCTHSQNMRNRKINSNSKHQYKGIRHIPKQHKKPWQAYIDVDGRGISLKYHKTPEDAARAYDTAAKIYHGEFARLNVPEG
jgi:hypothetical protein